MDEMESTARAALDALHAAGAQDGICQISESVKTEFYYASGTLGALNRVTDRTLSLKALIGNRKGVATIHACDGDALRWAAQAAVDAASVSGEDPCEGLPETVADADFSAGPEEPVLPEMKDRFDEFLTDFFRDFPRLSLDTASLDHTFDRSVYLSSNGIRLTTRRGLYGFSPVFLARDGKEASSFQYYGSVFTDLGTPLIGLSDGRQVMADTVAQIGAEPMKGKFKGTVLLSPSCFGGLLGSAEDQFLSDTALMDGTSPWKDKIGSAVASPLLSWNSSPTDPRFPGGYFTTEGYVAGDTPVVENGILKNFLLGRYAAKKTGLPRSASGGGCYVVRPGEKTLKELISSVSHGLLIRRFSGGEPGADGTVCGVAKGAFEIRNGKILRPVREAMFSGSLIRMLNGITALSSESVNDGSSLIPWAKIDGVTVSGS